MRLIIYGIAFLALASYIFISSLAVPLAQDAEQSQELVLSINGTKFEDRNGDGSLNDVEPGMAGWTINLMGNGLYANATTDTLGRYSFSGMKPGRYVVYEDSQQGWNQTSPGCYAYQVNLTDKNALNLNFGDRQWNSGVLVYREYALMHFSTEEITLMKEAAKSLPNTYLLSEEELTRRLGGPAGQSFSLLDKIEYCPAERDQGRCGNCWIWAGTGALEVDMAVKKGIKDRMSIQYLNSYYWCCDGGALIYYANLLNMTGMAVPWSNANAQWHDSATMCGKKSCVPVSFVSTNPCYRIVSARAEMVPTHLTGRDEAIKNIKNVLLQGRAIYFSFFMPTEGDARVFIDHWSNHSENEVLDMDYLCGRSWDERSSTGHAVICVGYDETDPDSRCWIMLNSWGTTPGRPHGLFRISMDMNYDCDMATEDGMSPLFEWDALSVQYGDPVISKDAWSSAGNAARVSEVHYRPLGSAGSPDKESIKPEVISWNGQLGHPMGAPR